MSYKPWHNLRYIKRIEITAPPTRKGGILASLEEDIELDEWHSDILNSRVMASRNRRIRLTDEVVTFHSDYPDDFKKLVYALDGDYQKAYNAYKQLQIPVPKDWSPFGEENV